MLGLGAKTGANTRILTILKVIEFCYYKKKKCQSGIWPILCQLMAILAKLLDMDFKFVLPGIYINFDIKTKFEVNQTQRSHSIPKNTPKNH